MLKKKTLAFAAILRGTPRKLSTWLIIQYA